MRELLTAAMMAGLVAAAAPQARADDDAKRAAAIVGAALILGTAALIHHEGHCEDGRSYTVAWTRSRPSSAATMTGSTTRPTTPDVTAATDTPPG